jgi:BolA protein
MEKHRQTAQQIEHLLEQSGASQVEVTDNSHLHVGHAGARSGGGHFAVFVVAAAFAGQSRIQRHRMVYQPLHDLFASGAIHALEVDAKTEEEL